MKMFFSVIFFAMVFHLGESLLDFRRRQEQLKNGLFTLTTCPPEEIKNNQCVSICCKSAEIEIMIHPPMGPWYWRYGPYAHTRPKPAMLKLSGKSLFRFLSRHRRMVYSSGCRKIWKTYQVRGRSMGYWLRICTSCG